jgi:hypothetical protein
MHRLGGAYATGWPLSDIARMHFPAKTALSILFLAITQVKALICYETVVLDALTRNMTVVEKEITSGFCQVAKCAKATINGGEPCLQKFPVIVGNKTNTVKFKYDFRQRAVSQCEKPGESYVPYMCCTTDRCNTIEAIEARPPSPDPVLVGLIAADLVCCFIAIVFATIYSRHLNSKVLKAIQALKIFNMSTSILLFLLLCVAKLPFSGSIEFILVFVASIISICIHVFDFVKKSIEQTKRYIIGEAVVFVLYIAGIIMLINKMAPWTWAFDNWAGICYFTPMLIGRALNISTDRNICAFIETIIGFGKLFFIL